MHKISGKNGLCISERVRNIKPEEVWKSVIGYEGSYEISNLGRIRSLDRYRSKDGIFLKGVLRKPQMDSRGYYQIGLYKDSKQKLVLLHRLVASHFIENPESKEQINHIDGNKLNNVSNNLEWCTRKENMVHASQSKLFNERTGTKNGRSKLDENSVIEMRKRRKQGEKITSLSKYYKVGTSVVSSICLGKSWKHLIQ